MTLLPTFRNKYLILQYTEQEKCKVTGLNQDFSLFIFVRISVHILHLSMILIWL